MEVSTAKPVQLEQPMEMEESNDNMDNGRPSALRRRNAKADKGITRPSSEDSYGISDGDGGIESAETAINNGNAR